jgi:hypothetical protein
MTNEALSRVKIDAQLRDQGWEITNTNAVRFEYVLPDRTKADYVLCDRNGRSLAAVEAKKAAINPAEAEDQAKAYPSHRLRFGVQRPLDPTTDDFLARINAAAEREDDGDPTDPKVPNWLLGDRQRHRGSLHQDIWSGTAAELANRGFIAVYPAKGWWRTRPAQERFDLPARYSLIVSIRTLETDVDLYTPIAQQVAAQAAVPVVVNT